MRHSHRHSQRGSVSRDVQRNSSFRRPRLTPPPAAAIHILPTDRKRMSGGAFIWWSAVFPGPTLTAA